MDGREYFANPPGQIRRYFANDFASYSTSSMVQFLTGTIIFDDQGVLSELQQEAAVWKSKKHEPLEPSRARPTSTPYGIPWIICWTVMKLKGRILTCLPQLFTCFFAGYCSLLNWEQIPFDHLFRYLAQPSYLESTGRHSLIRSLLYFFRRPSNARITKNEFSWPRRFSSHISMTGG